MTLRGAQPGPSPGASPAHPRPPREGAAPSRESRPSPLRPPEPAARRAGRREAGPRTTLRAAQPPRGRGQERAGKPPRQPPHACHTRPAGKGTPLTPRIAGAAPPVLLLPRRRRTFPPARPLPRARLHLPLRQPRSLRGPWGRGAAAAAAAEPRARSGRGRGAASPRGAAPTRSPSAPLRRASLCPAGAGRPGGGRPPSDGGCGARVPCRWAASHVTGYGAPAKLREAAETLVRRRRPGRGWPGCLRHSSMVLPLSGPSSPGSLPSRSSPGP